MAIGETLFETPDIPIFRTYLSFPAARGLNVIGSFVQRTEVDQRKQIKDQTSKYIEYINIFHTIINNLKYLTYLLKHLLLRFANKFGRKKDYLGSNESAFSRFYMFNGSIDGGQDMLL